MDSGRSLPVDRVASRIKECVFENRVTLIIGRTGCGKSSRVPQLLQEELNAPIICTQPRRLAVVAIARHVASSSGSPLGTAVGFRVGQKSVATAKTRVLFTTAGLLLEDIRANGSSALRRFSALVIDELHERSVESDLLLACLHALLMPPSAAAAVEASGSAAAGGLGELPNLKLVLMSATANVERYKRYLVFPGERVGLITCDVAERVSSAIGAWLETVKVVYLEQVVSKLLADSPNSAAHARLLERHRAGGISAQDQIQLPMQMLVCDLVLALHAAESDPEGVILVFLPTYKALELQHKLLTEQQQQRLSGSSSAVGGLALFPLHSSIDIDEAMRSMQAEAGGGRRKVILATNVAESSVTIPRVKHVIDTCTTNQVYWDGAACRERARVVWASQSAAEQRSGRTGRTCAGTAYRLLPRASYLSLDKFEASALTLRSLRREVLCLLSANSKGLTDPPALLARALDPPAAETVSAALAYLTQIGAAAPNAKGRLEPTPTGAFLAALPMSLESSLLLARGGQQGCLFEAAVLAALLNTTPYPIRQPFGAEATRFVRLYYGDGAATDAVAAAAAAAEQQQQQQWSGSWWGADAGTAGGAYDGYEAGRVGSSHSSYTRFTGGYSSFPGRPAAQPYSSSSSSSSGLTPGSRGSLDRAAHLLANLAAFEAWQKQWLDRQRLAQLVSSSGRSLAAAAGAAAAGEESGNAAGSDAGADPDASASGSSADELHWCEQHHLVFSSLRHLADTVSIIMSAVHKARPAFVHAAVGAPQYFTQQVEHECRTISGSGAMLASSRCSDGGSSGGCSCDGLQLSQLHSPDRQALLLQLLSQVFEGGTAAADAALLTFTTPATAAAAAASVGSRSSAALTIQQSEPPDGSDDDSLPVCKFFLSAGGCRRGGRCLFRHARPACRFFLSRGGCTYGDNCRFKHSLPADEDELLNLGGSDDSSTTASEEQQPLAQPGLAFDWQPAAAAAAAAGGGQPQPTVYDTILLPGNSTSTSATGSSSGDGVVLLLGEGDFSFTAAVVRRRLLSGSGSSPRLIASSYESRAQLGEIYPGRALRERLELLAAAGVELLFEADATKLHCLGPKQGVDWQQVSHIIWQLPLAASAEQQQQQAAGSSKSNPKLLHEDDEANRQLMRRFLAAAARQMVVHNPSMQVHVLLCLDQYSRWQLDSISRDSFLFLQQSRQLRLADWPGYSPRRGQQDGGFPTDRAVVYSFGLQLPASQQLSNVADLRHRLTWELQFAALVDGLEQLQSSIGSIGSKVSDMQLTAVGGSNSSAEEKAQPEQAQDGAQQPVMTVGRSPEAASRKSARLAARRAAKH